MSQHSTAIVQRATVEDIVRKRNLALDRYAAALEAIRAADAAVREAREAHADATPGVNGYNYGQAEEVSAFYKAVALPDPEQYLRVARRLVDTDVWAWIVQHTELERLMDKQAKDQLRAQMRYVPERVNGSGQIINGEEIARGMPEVTVENIVATLEQFRAEADTIFRRGIANAFSKLDRRFKSHDGFKVGGRVVLECAFDNWGHWNHYRNHRDTLMDIERTFAILDGKTVGETYATAIGAIDASRGGGYNPRQSEAETDYFKVRVFKNGNAHLWFRRPDLVQRVNKLLAEFYGEVIGDGNQAEEDVLASRKMTPARNWGFFPTPEAAARTMLDGFPLLAKKTDKALRVLEPSAGTGNLARLCADLSWRGAEWSGGLRAMAENYHTACRVDCVEVQPKLADALRASYKYAKVMCQDFLTLSPDRTGAYDRVVMNPPFDRERDIDHVTHALSFLKPDGCLVAIMSAGTQWRETRKAQAFRALVEKMNGTWRELPPGSFAETGTNVNTVVLRLYKDGRRRW